MDNNKNKRLNYQPNIEYTENYYANYGDFKFDKSVTIKIPNNDQNINDTITNNIQDNIDSLINMIPILPTQIQTTINQVFKPIFNEWYDNLKKETYPEIIPSTDSVIEPKPPSGGRLPDEDSPGDNSNTVPGDNPSTVPDYNNPGTPTVWPTPPKNPKPIEPYIYTPDPYTPVIPTPSTTINPTYSEVDDDIFAPSSPFIVTYPEVDEVEVIKMEYVKNIYDLYSFYTSRLKEVVGNLLQGILTAILSAETDEQFAFINRDVSLEDVEIVDKELKHIIDAAIRNEIIGLNKVSFCENMFTIESSLYHCKNFKSCYELRLRYAEIQKQEGTDKINSDCNTILRGMEKLYDRKYDTAYINLYKYLNSSANVMEDCFNTLIDGLLSKNTLIKKGGYNK